ncbi:M10 family metallopeptidase C-terminal domain-containing protein [Bradyrhizobium elkanii]|uniref:M10 family metallopeptidase C-terminal domain-containing protein n=1 Tax=Bradyrhizobium elkanii TaxID=29448 RepID=UPI003D247791
MRISSEMLFDDSLAVSDPVSAPTVDKTISQAGVQITRDNYHWDTTLGAAAGPITFGFATSGPSYAVSGHDVSGFSAFTASEKTAVEAALAFWSSIAGITFSDQGSTNNATILFRNYSDPNDASEAFAYLPQTNNQTAGNWEGDVFMNLAFANANAVTPGTYEWVTLIHEIGHALGLEHPGAYNAAPGQTITYNNNAEYIEDSRQYTVMSYFSETSTGGSFSIYNETPGLDDIAAIQRLYGANTSTRTGNDVYGFNSNVGGVYSITSSSQHSVFSVWDAGGIDRFDFSGYTQNQVIDLRVNSGTDIGHFSSVGGDTNNIAIGAGVVIENAIGGSGNDTFYGNTSDNILSGNGGSDTMVFAGDRSQFIFTESNNHNYTTTGAGQGTDALNNIERFQFNDITVTDDWIGGTATSVSVSVGGSATGDIQFNGDRDWFAVTLTAGQHYVVDEYGTATSHGTLTDPYVRLYNASGTQVAFNDDGGVGLDSQLAIVAANSGTYYVAAGGYNDASLGTYTVHVATPAPTFQVANFAAGAGGWSSDNLYPRELADVNGDGKADIVGFGQAGVYESLASGNGPFATQTFELAAFAPGAGGWSSDNLYPRELADVNGDGMADIVGFGQAGVYVSLATGNGHFAAQTFELAAFAPGAGGWSSDNLYPRELADVNGDGMADIVGFGQAGVYVSLASGNGHFAAPTFELAAFAPGAGGWSSDDLYPRELADVNGDGKADIVGFGQAGVYVSLASGNGHFAAQTFELAAFAPGAGGWSSDNLYPRELADANGDGKADIVGFGQAGVYESLASGNGHFATQTFELAAFAPGAGGWSSDNLYPRELADANGDGTADIVGFGQAGVYMSQSHNFLLV